MKRQRLLVCDDEPAICQIIRQVAEPLGYDVIEVTVSKLFAETYDSFRPDIIILDIIMPDRDGIEIVRWLMAQRFDGRIILISGYDPHHSRTTRILAEDYGLKISEVLRKPISIAALRKILVGPAS